MFNLLLAVTIVLAVVSALALLAPGRTPEVAPTTARISYVTVTGSRVVVLATLDALTQSWVTPEGWSVPVSQATYAIEGSATQARFQQALWASAATFSGIPAEEV